MEQTLAVLNDLERQGVLGRYAIGGAVGAIFYMEPFATFDLDIFVILPTRGLLVTLEPLYDELRKRGYEVENECVMIEGVPVQFLPAYNALIEEALEQAADVTLGDVPARVLSAEHLLAVMLQTGRAKDRQRFIGFMEEASIDNPRLKGILERHDLLQRFESWKRPPSL